MKRELKVEKHIGTPRQSTPSADKEKKTNWAGLDSNQRKLTLMGLQPVAPNSQLSTKKEVTSSSESRLQTSLQKHTNATLILPEDFPTELAEVMQVWPELSEAIKAAILALVHTNNKGTIHDYLDETD